MPIVQTFNVPPVSSVLVLGATGKTGARVAQGLRNHGVTVREGSRNASPAFDWEDAATWEPALAGMDGVYISYQPDLAAPGAEAAIAAFADAAKAAGVRHLVLLSGRGEPAAQRCEAIVQNSGLAWTVLRAAWFNQNFSEGHLLEPVLAGVIALPAGNVAEPFVDADDLADAAIAAFTDVRHLGQLYEMTGPRALTFSEVAGILSDALGRTIHYQPMETGAYVDMLSDYVPRAFAEFLGGLFSEVLDGRNTQVADGVQRSLGRAPRDFADYVRDAAKTGAWSALAVSG
ncbi:NmrA family NAD(P)-binding protein [Ralstonia pickettii]|uniref:NmrA family NAD(P)-binding protein n=1 Tax=Ralstonia pickettii TaxID=329 RepID=UPI0015BEB187|nr:NmrA family NAD(P)-binding protein [Ralstonia pickettii]NWK47213.1 NmrA family NAD(P)-binding protein [Ralstonia pickettii]